jgi:hypothetical protein
MAIPAKNGIYSIIKAALVMLRMAAKYSNKWGEFLSPTDLALVNDLISCAEAVVAALERNEYRPE